MSETIKSSLVIGLKSQELFDDFEEVRKYLESQYHDFDKDVFDREKIYLNLFNQEFEDEYNDEIIIGYELSLKDEYYSQIISEDFFVKNKDLIDKLKNDFFKYFQKED